MADMADMADMALAPVFLLGGRNIPLEKRAGTNCHNCKSAKMINRNRTAEVHRHIRGSTQTEDGGLLTSFVALLRTVLKVGKGRRYGARRFPAEIAVHAGK
jgi:hypothetical protein